MLMDQLDMVSVSKKTGSNSAGHVPVMLNEVLEYLQPGPGQTFVDGTLGLGGHALNILERVGSSGRLIGLDRDRQALAKAQENLAAFKSQCHFVHENFFHLGKVLRDLNIERVDGILLDLGISSFQLDDPRRGFGIRQDGPLDMRMDLDTALTAFHLVNSASEQEIAKILKEYGQERWHFRIARYIVHERSKQPIATTQELSHVVLRAMPRHARREKIHPATRTFQAFRIAVNRELEAIEGGLDQCADLLNAGGRIGVISFHSLEDRIVKLKFREYSKSGKMALIVKKPIRPDEKEVRMNPRARSARLRIAERVL